MKGEICYELREARRQRDSWRELAEAHDLKARTAERQIEELRRQLSSAREKGEQRLADLEEQYDAHLANLRSAGAT
jgi:F0F1-type ATP synthase membrane subunit b/b'